MIWFGKINSKKLLNQSKQQLGNDIFFIDMLPPPDVANN